jgi:CubicO group peptidase (beta-lactamase class C family)
MYAPTVANLLARLTDIQQRLDAISRHHRVPGAVLAIGSGDELLDFATGVVNVNTGVEATTDSIFQIGSNTKLFTTTLVMQLVDAGKLDLDKPVKRYLPDFALDDQAATDQITTRHLLTHTSGIEGDYFQGFGRGDDAMTRYVESLRDIGLVHRPGQLWSYCNTGFVVAGRLVEVLGGAPFHDLFEERICRPSGLTRTTLLLEEMIAHRCAVGHLPAPQGRQVVPPTVVMETAAIPAGSRTTATAADLVRFVQMHLDGGLGANGERVLSGESVRKMQEVQVTRPEISTGSSTQGLGWLMADWGGRKVIGHGGGTIGQLSFLQAVPEENLVVALVTNSATGAMLWRDLGRWLFEELAGVQMAGVPQPGDPAPELPLERYAGRYERLGVGHIVSVEEGQLVVRTELIGPIAELRQEEPEPPLRLRPVDPGRFTCRLGGQDLAVAFLEFDRGRPSYLFTGSRAARRVTSRRSRPASASRSV